MAAFIKRGVFKTGQLISSKNGFPRCYATKAEKKKDFNRKEGPKIDSSTQSLATKGFLRAQNEYIPPEDLESKLNSIFMNLVGQTNETLKITDLKQRYNLFLTCSNQFKHSIPNSMLCSIETLGDIKQFYATPIDTRTPLDKMRNMELPENLHVQFEYHRFHPDIDTKFKGLTAFNKSSTFVTSLKYKNKYPGYKTEKTISHI